MNTIRCFFLGAIVVISSATLALGGDMQVPGKSDPTPTPAPAVSALTSTSDRAPQPKATEENQIVWQHATKMLLKILITIF